MAGTTWLLGDMLRVCPQTGRIVEREAAVRSVREYGRAGGREGGRGLTIRTPRNAYVSFQIVVENAGDREVAIALEAPLVPELYVEWFHRIGERYIPDALIPWGAGNCRSSPFLAPARLNRVPGQRYGAIWADLFVPADFPPGTHRWRLVVRNGEAEESHELTLAVLKAAVPDEQTITADLNNYADSLSPHFAHVAGRDDRYADGSYFRLERQFFRMAHEHRALFHLLPYHHSGYVVESFRPVLEGAGKTIRVKDWSLFDEHFGPYLDGSAFRDTRRGPIPLTHLYLPFNFHWPADYAKFGMKGYRTEFQTVLRAFYDHCTRMGWRSTTFELFLNHKKRYKLFPYDGDETRFLWDEKINDLFYDLARDVLYRRDGARFVFRTDASWAYGLHWRKYAGIIKHWVVNGLIFMWYPEAPAHLRREGCTVWTYGSAFALGEPLLATAICPLVCVARHTDGFTFWNTVGWGRDWHVTPASDGATALFYPGEALFGIFGPLPSIRLKVLRNAQQAAECMERWIARRGPDGRAAMARLIEETLGLGPRELWAAKPDFLDRPPYTWDNEQLSEAAPVDLHRGKAPERFDALRERLWSALQE